MTESTRKKPSFLRKDWHKKIKLGRQKKSIRKWRAAKGRQNKIRLGVKGHQARPKAGWASPKKTKGLIEGLVSVRVETLSQLDNIKKNEAAVIGKVGKKKKAELIKKANEMKIKILNKYKEEKNESK
jgi:large subunit ribosomal protein L32e